MKKYLIIKADTNDADYVTSQIKVTDKELTLIKPLITAIKEYSGNKFSGQYNWWWVENSRKDYPTPEELYLDSGLCSTEAFDTFAEMVPHFEGGIHTIESITLLTVTKEEVLL